MTETIPPLSDAARIELALRKRRAKGATCRELAAELSMYLRNVEQFVATLVYARKAEAVPDTDRFRIIRS